jgi:hypothetical protein
MRDFSIIPGRETDNSLLVELLKDNNFSKVFSQSYRMQHLSNYPFMSECGEFEIYAATDGKYAGMLIKVNSTPSFTRNGLHAATIELYCEAVPSEGLDIQDAFERLVSYAPIINQGGMQPPIAYCVSADLGTDPLFKRMDRILEKYSLNNPWQYDRHSINLLFSTPGEKRLTADEYHDRLDRVPVPTLRMMMPNQYA